MSLHTKFQREKMRKQYKNNQIHRINGWLSLQLELRVELGLRLRLINYLTFKISDE
jgi:hypothetical protein